MTVREAKNHIGDIWQLGHLLGWPLTPGMTPDFAFWRGNRGTPALSIFANGQLWRDHGNTSPAETWQAGGDMVDLLATVEGHSKGKACARIVEIAKGVAETPAPVLWAPGRTRDEKRADWPTTFRRLEDEELFDLARQRRFPHFAGVRAASDRGLLVSLDGFDGEPWPIDAWGLTDSAREAVRIRRLDGKPWSTGKTKMLPGSLGSWPIGIAEVGTRQDVIFCEGEPDLLAALTLHCLLSPRGEFPADPGTFGFCCMSASGSIAPAALSLFRGKSVRIVPHIDPAGAGALDTWGNQLVEAGALVRHFDLARMTKDDGTPAKDLNDVTTERGLAAYRAELAQLFLP